jgi:hypothetical protein
MFPFQHRLKDLQVIAQRHSLFDKAGVGTHEKHEKADIRESNRHETLVNLFDRVIISQNLNNLQVLNAPIGDSLSNELNHK